MIHQFCKHAFLVLFSMLLSSCDVPSSQLDDNLALERSLQSVIDAAVESDNSIPGAIVHVEAPRIGFSWGGASGVVDQESRNTLSAEHPVRLGSQTKTFVAAATLRLWEQGLLDLDAPISEYLEETYLETLHVDGYDTDRITIRHLLTHTSGLFDYAITDEYLQRVFNEPQKRWTRLGQLQGAIEWGEPYGEPGEIFAYSDTGYILLGEIVEETVSQSLGQALRELLEFERLSIRSTWQESIESRPDDALDRAHQYVGEIDTYSMDPSLDLFGGGGLAGTMSDLAVFMRSLFTTGVYDNPQTMEVMLTTIDGVAAGPDYQGMPQVPGRYRMGIEVGQIQGMTGYYHGGFWGTYAVYIPELDLAIATAINQQESTVGVGLVNQTIALVADAIRHH